MTMVNGCTIPEDLFYNVESNVWARRESDGSLTIGMTSYACSLSGEIVSFMAKKPGKLVRQNKSCATVESGKWVGPVKAPVTGEISEINELLLHHPELINRDPYGEGWIVRIKPTDWENEVSTLVTGEEALRLFDQKMAEDGFGGC